MEPPFTRDRILKLDAEITSKIEEDIIQKTANAIKNSILWCIVNPNSTPRGGLGCISRITQTKIVITFNKIQYSQATHPIDGQPTMLGGHYSKHSGVLERVKRMFPDCVFTTDPLDTYMIIDWS